MDERQINKLIEAIWRAIVGDDTPTKDDGELVIQNPYDLSTAYHFMYKGSEAVILTIKYNPTGKFSYFIQSEKVTPKQVMEQFLEVCQHG